MGVQGELGVRPTRAEYCTVHGGLKSLSEELVALEGTVSDRIDALNIGAVRLEVSLAVAQIAEVKLWMEQMQGMGGARRGAGSGRKRRPSGLGATSWREPSPK